MFVKITDNYSVCGQDALITKQLLWFPLPPDSKQKGWGYSPSEIYLVDLAAQYIKKVNREARQCVMGAQITTSLCSFAVWAMRALLQSDFIGLSAALLGCGWFFDWILSFLGVFLVGCQSQCLSLIGRGRLCPWFCSVELAMWSWLILQYWIVGQTMQARPVEWGRWDREREGERG